jgi:hypothetical protein
LTQHPRRRTQVVKGVDALNPWETSKERPVLYVDPKRSRASENLVARNSTVNLGSLNPLDQSIDQLELTRFVTLDFDTYVWVSNIQGDKDLGRTAVKSASTRICRSDAIFQPIP